MPRILLIEPDKMLARNIQSYFGGGHQVDWQADPQSAIASADEATPDLVILDIVLAGHNGIELLYELRSYPDWQKLPVIIYSSIPRREVGQSSAAFEHLDINSYHYKPQTTLKRLAQSVELALQPA